MLRKITGHEIMNGRLSSLNKRTSLEIYKFPPLSRAPLSPGVSNFHRFIEISRSRDSIAATVINIGDEIFEGKLILSR